MQKAFPVLALALVWALVAVAGFTLGSISTRVKADANDLSGAKPDRPAALLANPPGVHGGDDQAAGQAEVTSRAGEIVGDDFDASVRPVRVRTCQIPDSLVQDLAGDLAVAVSLAGGDTEVSPLLFGINEGTAVAPASVVKLFTAVAALETLGPDFRFRTRVVGGDVPGEIWLIGGGDVTLTRAAGWNYYDSEAHLEELAATTVAALVGGDSWANQGGDAGISRVWVDDSRYERFDRWDESWRPGSAALGYIAPVSALQVDGDRDHPGVRLSPRSTDPSARAAQWFADALWRSGGGNPEVARGDAAPEGRVLAEVASAPLSQLLRIMLVDSDNSLAEVISREVALSLDPRGERGLTPGEAVREAVQAVFVRSGRVSKDVLEGAVIHDGSGLSSRGAISAESVLSLLQLIERSPELEQVHSSLPVAGQSGSLRKRYRVVSSDLQGLVRAKTGSIRGTRSLAGYLESPGGHSSAGDRLAFSLVLSGDRVSDASRNDIDRLVGALALCGENLADWSGSNN
ncbi:MAG: D-alanyl-D-alanine carboxypeptidase/D-alanyl-D-alanine-endopeptidase [Pontimonas sp.]